MRILWLKHALHGFLDTPGTSADHVETSMPCAPCVARYREKKVRWQHLRRLRRLGEPVCTLDRAFERARRLCVDDANRAQQIALLHAEL
jgi:hypothetical protein